MIEIEVDTNESIEMIAGERAIQRSANKLSIRETGSREAQRIGSVRETNESTDTHRHQIKSHQSAAEVGRR